MSKNGQCQGQEPRSPELEIPGSDLSATMLGAPVGGGKQGQ